MGIINILDPQVANLIAAGEVVERPSSVIKELMENSIDAGATSITVEIQRGGISYIKITDNGKGMSPEDARLCFLRHATSKIHCADDLDGILTLGFRGEALAAISSVSKMRILTKQKGDNTGTLVCCEGGNITEVRETGCADGTTVISEQLFYNVPARRKFLKKDSTEAMAIASTVEKIAISEPGIAIKFISDGIVRFNTSGNGKLYDVIYAVYGKEFAKKLIEVNDLTEGIEVSGYISNPDFVRVNRNFQNFYINDRYVKSKTVIAAFEQAYDSYIPADKFPGCVLKIKIHPSFVDVNVHPAKLEVKFSNEQSVFDAVYCAIRNTLVEKIRRPELEVPDIDTKLTGDEIRLHDPAYKQNPAKEDPKTAYAAQDRARLDAAEQSGANGAVSYFAPAFAPARDISKTDIRENGADDIDKDEQQSYAIDIPAVINTPVTAEKALPPEDVNRDSAKSAYKLASDDSPADRRVEAVPEYKIIGEAFDSYVFVECRETVLIIDKHAAHERIIFEELKRNMQKGNDYSQILLIPISAELSKEEFAAVTDFRSEIEKTGFAFETSDGSTVIKLLQLPSEISPDSAAEVFTEMAGRLASGFGGPALAKNILYEKALYQASCKAAIKAGRHYGPGHIKWICDKILALPDIKFCPHGRPVAFELSKKDFEHQFKRI